MREALAERRDFSIETTLSGVTQVRLAARAKRDGWRIGPVHVGLSSADVSLERVRQRVLDGGHDVPELDVRRRFPRGLHGLARLSPRTDYTAIHDNSGGANYEMQAGFEYGQLTFLTDPPLPWVARILAGFPGNPGPAFGAASRFDHGPPTCGAVSGARQ